MLKIDIKKTELVWSDKYDEEGKLKLVERVNLPFQIVEAVNAPRIGRAKEDRQLSLFDFYEAKEGDTFEKGWKNKLIWGDNKLVISSLLENFAGKINLIYIDPPFATGADFKFRVQVGDEDEQITKEHSILEEKAYRDTWGSGWDSYLRMMYERLILMKELLAENGSIYVHLDWHVGHYVKVMMDEIFGMENLRNEIITRRGQTKNLAYQFEGLKTMNVYYDTVLWYSSNPDSTFNPPMKKALDYQRVGRWQSMWNNADRPTMRYELLGANITTGQWKWSKERAYQAVGNYEEFLKATEKTQETLEEYWERTGRRSQFIGRKGNSKPQYWVSPQEDVICDNNWLDIKGYDYHQKFRTQKSEALLKRIILASSNPGDIVADFFCGSGTTLAVAEKLGRRWIGCDLSRYAIHITRKRLLEIENSKDLFSEKNQKYAKKVHPFEILNLGKYERQIWQGITFGSKDKETVVYQYLAFILKLYGAEPISGLTYIHGRKDSALVHIGAVDTPVTIQEIISAMKECKASGQRELHALGWEWEMGLNDAIQDMAKNEKIKLYLRIIPNDVMEKQAVEKGDVRFFELAYFRVAINGVEPEHDKPVVIDNRTVKVELKDFVIPHTDLIPDNVREKITKWTDWIDYWAIDFDFQNDAFNNYWTSYRTKKNRKLVFKPIPYTYKQAGKYKIFVKIIDIFGIDTSQIFELEAK